MRCDTDHHRKARIDARNRPYAHLGKLAAAIGLGILGWVGSELFRPLMPEDTNFGWFNYVNVVLGVICGWRVTGTDWGAAMPKASAPG